MTPTDCPRNDYDAFVGTCNEWSWKPNCICGKGDEMHSEIFMHSSLPAVFPEIFGFDKDGVVGYVRPYGVLENK